MYKDKKKIYRKFSIDFLIELYFIKSVFIVL